MMMPILASVVGVLRIPRASSCKEVKARATVQTIVRETVLSRNGELQHVHFGNSQAVLPEGRSMVILGSNISWQHQKASYGIDAMSTSMRGRQLDLEICFTIGYDTRDTAVAANRPCQRRVAQTTGTAQLETLAVNFSSALLGRGRDEVDWTFTCRSGTVDRA